MPIAPNYAQDQSSSSKSTVNHHFPSPRHSNLASPPATWNPHSQQDTSSDNGSDTTKILEARYNGRISPTETRQELISRLKKDQRATWLNNGGNVIAQTAPAWKRGSRPGSPVQQGGQPSSEPSNREDDVAGNVEAAMTIERPRSALHRGDFREQSTETQRLPAQPDSPRPIVNPWLSTSPTTPWFTPRHVPERVPVLRPQQTIATDRLAVDTDPLPIQQRARAATYSARSASFVLRPPTSPLVNETQNSDSERDDLPRRGRNGSPERSSRRRTFSPTYLKGLRQNSFQGDYPSRIVPSVKRENSLPYQAHQPRRSASSFSEQLSAPGTPSARSRRPSVASETSPLQRMPMVGRYEESILRGRMSSLPSRPLDFVAQIGVLGKGDCKPSLRCPPHVTIPFPAVFYHYGSRPGSPSSPTVSEGPSPYVGMIDVDSHLTIDEKPKKRIALLHTPQKPTKALRSSSPREMDEGVDYHRRLRRSRNRSTVEQQLPRGGYRIPEQGQLQIIIKNPNKTAVKLFLVPYDLSGMEPGQKTFVRQRSYSAGPILDMPLSARKNLGTDRPEAALSSSEDPNDRPVLRYLIHLNICCPSKGRWYLYKSVRVVFANRVPDGKEKLRQEIQVPEPRFSPWKPEKENQPVAERSVTMPHFSYGGEFGSSPPPHGTGFAQHVADSAHADVGNVELQTRNFTFPMKTLTTSMSRPPSRQRSDADGDIVMSDADALHSPRSSTSSSRRSLLSSPSFRPSSRHTFERLSRDMYSNGSASDRAQSPQPGQGLLALQLRDLADGNGSQ